MTIARPLAWIVLALAIPLVAAYVHRRSQRHITVGSAILYRAIASSTARRRGPIFRLRHPFSLALAVAALLAGVTALVDLRRPNDHPHDTLVILDTSASMGASNTAFGETRFTEAIDRLTLELANLGPGDRAALITSGAETRVRVEWTHDLTQVLQATEGMTPSGSSDSMALAFALADAMAERSLDARVVLLSDGVGVPPPRMKRPLEYAMVGRPGSNLGISALALRELDGFGLCEVFLSVVADDPDVVEVDIDLRVDDTLVDVIPVPVRPDGESGYLHRLELPDGQRLHATLGLHGRDVLAIDDTATVARQAGTIVRVLLITSSTRSFVADALRTHPRVDLTIVGPGEPTPTAAFDLAIVGAELQGRPLPRATKLLAFGVDPTTVGLTSPGPVKDPTILRWSFDDLRFRFVDLTTSTLGRTWIVNPSTDVLSLVDSEYGPLGVSYRFEDRDAMYLGWNPADSDFVFQVSFVHLIGNAIDWARHFPVNDSDTIDAVVPAEESQLDPRPSISGTTPEMLTPAQPTSPPLARVMMWLALLFVAFDVAFVPVRWALYTAVKFVRIGVPMLWGKVAEALHLPWFRRKREHT